MTLVGDVAQTSAAGGASSWASVLEPYVADRWRLAELTVNYRTPSEIMDVAADALAELDPALRPPTSVRDTGVRPSVVPVGDGDLGSVVAAVVADELAEVGDGTLAVVSPAAHVEELRRRASRPRVSVLTVERAKGLEFDAVVVVDPEAIAEGSARGYSDLYVALTRATQRLAVVHNGTQPPRWLGGASRARGAH